MLVRWNGKTWSTGTSFPVSGIQRSLEGVATGPRGTAFAVGNGWAVGARGADTLILHWNGHSWS
jgi:hypothetical protein